MTPPPKIGVREGWSDEPQMVMSYDDEGGIAKMIANQLTTARDGSWVLPFWREMGGAAECRQQAELHGLPGVLLSRDQARPVGAWRR